MDLRKWSNFLLKEDDDATIMDPMPSAEGSITIPSGQSAGSHILSEMGYEIQNELGRGKYGTVVKAVDKETSSPVAVKIIISDPLSVKREVTNYKFLVENRDKLGERKKYFPKVYSSEMKVFNFTPTEVNPRPPTSHIGIIVMELLSPLPSRIKTDLLATGGLQTGPRGRFDRRRVNFTQRDKRLFKSHDVLLDLSKTSIMESQMLQNLFGQQFRKLIEHVPKRAVSRFLKGDYQDIDGEAYPALQLIVSENWRGLISGRQGQVLFLLTLIELHNFIFPKNREPRIAYMSDSLTGAVYNQVFEAFLRAYVRPVIPGTLNPYDSTAIMKPQHSSALAQFPEAQNFVQFMQDMKQLGIVGRDMHAGNFLMRPSDNEIVVVDLGLFNIREVIEIPDKGETVPFFEERRRKGRRRRRRRMKREVASCFIIDEQDRFLIVRRSNTDMWRPLHWEIPGGKIDDTDNTANEAAIREVYEETGLSLSDCRFMKIYKSKHLIRFYFISRRWSGDVQIPITNPDGIIEHDEYKWVTIDDLRSQKDLIIPVQVFEEALYS